MSAKSDLKTFDDYRVAATREFAHTMIVVDDEAWKPKTAFVAARAGLRPPRRGRVAPVQTSQQEQFEVRHALNTDALVRSAMNLGLVCSIIRPPKASSIRAQVGEAARRADIVCLDWEIHNDSGDAATGMIVEIVRADDRRNGRLRLIAIYTGDTSNNEILKKVFDAIPQSYRKRHKLKRDAIRIESNHGLQIVCLFKAHGVQLADARKERQVREEDLPERLLHEFARLAGGLLSNVALATIASIRNSTHHVLVKMSSSMDGPYFHHRATVEAAPEAEEYGVDVVLSDLKSAVDKTDVAQRFAGAEAIAARIQEIAGASTSLRLTHGKPEALKQFDLDVTDAIKIVVDGSAVAYPKVTTANKPALKAFRKDMSTLFTADVGKAKEAMLEFALLTGVRAHPGSHLYREGRKIPQLGLGSIVVSDDKRYFLCLQASCDSVRLKSATAFLFMPLAITDDAPELVVPTVGAHGIVHCIGLSAPARAYAQSRSIRFEPVAASHTVIAIKLPRRRGLFFSAVDGSHFKWVADLKQRRALRAAQKLGQSLGRLGFDEFEPFRQSDE
jgi:Response receiver domain